MQQTLNSFVFPASHEASNCTGTDLPRMGERFRLKASFVIPSNWSPEAKAIAQAMKDYGLIVADNGSDMFFQGTPSDQWNMDAMLQIQAIPATDFEVVDLTPVVTGLERELRARRRRNVGHDHRPQFLRGRGPTARVLRQHRGDVRHHRCRIARCWPSRPLHAAGTVDMQVQSGSMRTEYRQPVGVLRLRHIRHIEPRTISPSAQPLPLRLPAAATAPAAPSGTGAAIRDRQRSGASGDRHHVQPGSHGPVHGPAVRGIVQGGRAGRGGGRDRRRRAGCSGRDRWRNRGAGPHHRWRHDAVLSTQLLGTTSYTGKVSVAVGDVTGDGIDDIALGTNQAGPRAQVFRGGDFLKLSDVVAGPSTNFLGRTFVALADMDHDAKADLS